LPAVSARSRAWATRWRPCGLAGADTRVRSDRTPRTATGVPAGAGRTDQRGGRDEDIHRDGRALCLVGALMVGGISTATGSSAHHDDGQAAAIVAIHDLQASFHHAVSGGGHIDELAGLWAPDATFTAGGNTIVGRDAIRAFFLNAASSNTPPGSRSRPAGRPASTFTATRRTSTSSAISSIWQPVSSWRPGQPSPEVRSKALHSACTASGSSKT
jgi:hypothetical protein